jgi:integrating conjugative element protein (TIGR03752 family)
MKKKSPPIAKLAAIIVVGFVGYQVFFSDSEAEKTITPKPTEPAKGVNQNSTSATQDSTQETINAITAQLGVVTNQLTSLQQSQQTSNKETEQKYIDLAQTVDSRKQAIESDLTTLQNEVNSLSTSRPGQDSPTYAVESQPPATTQSTSIYDNIGTTNAQLNAMPLKFDGDGYVIIEPVSVRSRPQVTEEADSSGLLTSFNNLTSGATGNGRILNGSGGVDESVSADTALGQTFKRINDLKVPYITIPENTRLFNAKSRSTILGRIPRGGKVENPYEFMVELSGDNVTSGGFNVPHLDKVYMRGVAVGDPALVCVRGSIFSMTFIFDDGTISQIGGSDTKNNNSPLATILDNRATECIPGDEVGNEAVYAAGQLTAQGIQSIANAKAKAQTETIGTSGSSATNVTGSESALVFSELLGGLGQAGSELMANRYSSVFNAIKVNLDTSFIIEIKKQIEIDYDPNGRKLFHGNAATNGAHSFIN